MDPTHEQHELIENNGSEKKDKEYSKGGEVHAATGLTLATSILFITGEMTGSGVLALPKAVRDAGWIGIVLIIMCAGISSFTGTVLGRCWVMIRRNVKDLPQHVADPYPMIGKYAFGNAGRNIVTASVYFTLYGVCVVLLLIASGNIQMLLKQVNVDISLCYWIIIIGLALAPFCWLKSPKDFWPIALMATLTTFIACILICIQAALDVEKAMNETLRHQQLVDEGKEKPFERGFEAFFLAFGMILFCFGGMAAFPTIQADMRNPKQFPKTVGIAMLAIIAAYIPVGAMGFGVFGDLVADNVFDSISDGPMKTVAVILITMHLVFAYVIIQNPLSQIIEMPFKIPDEFGWKRVLARTMVNIVIIFTGESCPKFGHILALVGGSAVTLNTFVFPSVFFLRFCSLHGGQWKEAKCKSIEKPVHYIIILIGIIGGISATYSAIRGITDPSAFVPPCYVNITAASMMGGGGGGH